MQETGNQLPAHDTQAILDSATNADKIGSRQFFTRPHTAAALVSLLPPYRPNIADPCGSGDNSLLIAAAENPGTERAKVEIMGCDIDSRIARPRGHHSKHWSLANGDITRLYPLLCQVGWRADTMLSNPPFSLKWHADRLADLGKSRVPGVADTYREGITGKGTIDSTLASFLIMLERLSDYGEGLLIANADTVQRLILDSVHMQNRYCWKMLRFPSQHISSNMGTGFTACALYFSRNYIGACDDQRCSSGSPDGLAEFVGGQERSPQLHPPSATMNYRTTRDSLERWIAAADKLRIDRGEKQPPANIYLDMEGRIRTHLTPFQSFAGTIPHELACQLNKLNGNTPVGLTVQKETRNALRLATNTDIWTVDPRLSAAVEAALQAYLEEGSPLQKPNPDQCLGWLDEHDHISCIADFAGGAFKAGHSYALHSYTESVTRQAEVRNAVTGEKENVERSGSELVLRVTPEHGEPHFFVIKHAGYEFKTIDLEAPEVHNLSRFREVFEVPEVKSLAERKPEQAKAMTQRLDQLQMMMNTAYV